MHEKHSILCNVSKTLKKNQQFGLWIPRKTSQIIMDFQCKFQKTVVRKRDKFRIQKSKDAPAFGLYFSFHQNLRYCKNFFIRFFSFLEPNAQSICTHYSSLSGTFLGSGTENKVQNMGCKKQGAKNRVRIFFCFSEREEAAWPLLF